MNTCKVCGAERRYIGVMFPARSLCGCETGECSIRGCTASAVLVEFQQRITADEPKVPSRNARLYCVEHRPEGFPTKALVEEEPQEVVPKKKREHNKGHKLHIDPVWESISGDRLPPRAESHERVQCIACKLEHEMCQRVMFNGDFSYCPNCNENMYVPIWSEEGD